MARLLNIKFEYHLSKRCYDSLLEFMHEILPVPNSFPSNFYSTKKLIEGLGLPVQKIDCCECGCLIFRGVYEELRAYKFYDQGQYK